MRKDLIEYFEDREIIGWDYNFIQGCIRFQNEYPQLTGRQWDRLLKLKSKYEKVLKEKS